MESSVSASASASSFTTLILEPLGFLLSPHYSPQLPRKLLRRLLYTTIWYKYQRGRLALSDAAAQLAQLPFLAPRWAHDDLVTLLRPTSVHAVPWMLPLLDLLQDKLHLKVVCLINMPVEELQELRRQFPALFAKFHATVTSGEEGVGKPSLRFLQVALDKAGAHAQQTLYLDSFESLETIMAARSLGMHAIPVEPCDVDDLNAKTASGQLQDSQLIKRILRAIRGPESVAAQGNSPLISTFGMRRIEASPAVSDSHRRSAAIASAQQFFLQVIAAHHPEKPFIQLPSLTSEGIQIWDNFAQFLIADLLEDTRFLPMPSPPPNGLITFVNTSAYLAADIENDTHRSHVTNKMDRRFYVSDACTFVDFPNDLDTTSIGLSVLHKFGKVDKDTLNRVLDTMLEHVSEDDGILQVYFDVQRPRIDPVAAANILFLFHLGKRGHEVERSEKFVQSVLLQRAYEEGTLYYNLGEAFLLSVARLVHKFKDHFARSGMRRALEGALRERAREGVRESDDALALAMRIRACALCGLAEEGLTRAAEEELLRRQSKAKGSWGCYPFYRYGSNVLSWIGNEGLTTAYAITALQLTSL